MDIKTHIVGTAIWTSGAFVVGFGLSWAKKKIETRGLKAILGDFAQPAIFVYPRCTGNKSDLLPQTATEDFLASNNLISAFRELKVTPPDTWRFAHIPHMHPQKPDEEPRELKATERESHNLILIGSTRGNDETKQALQKLSVQFGYEGKIPTFVEGTSRAEGSRSEYSIRWKQDARISPSYAQDAEEAALKKAGEAIAPEKKERNDFAIIIKARNPWNKNYKILIVGGIRGIGTWGAAKLLRRWPERIDGRKWGGTRGDFSALIRVTYKDGHLVDAECIQRVDLPSDPH